MSSSTPAITFATETEGDDLRKSLAVSLAQSIY